MAEDCDEERGIMMILEAVMQKIAKNMENAKLTEIAKNMPDLNTDIADLDKPMMKEIAEKKGLTDAEKLQVKRATGWSNEIVDYLDSMEEYQIYKNAGLSEFEIGGETCLIREINFAQMDPWGCRNMERVLAGLAPIDQSGYPIELHHIGKRGDSPLAELTHEEHHMHGHSAILHDPAEQAGMDRIVLASEREAYWKERGGWQLHASGDSAWVDGL